jgi:hypothetical protein
VSERGLREAVLGKVDWQKQRRRWQGLKLDVSAAT